jgi:hypothetical protein
VERANYPSACGRLDEIERGAARDPCACAHAVGFQSPLARVDRGLYEVCGRDSGHGIPIVFREHQRPRQVCPCVDIVRVSTDGAFQESDTMPDRRLGASVDLIVCLATERMRYRVARAAQSERVHPTRTIGSECPRRCANNRERDDGTSDSS